MRGIISFDVHAYIFYYLSRQNLQPPPPPRPMLLGMRSREASSP